jgi:hypothetical protein
MTGLSFTSRYKSSRMFVSDSTVIEDSAYNLKDKAVKTLRGLSQFLTRA